VNIFEAQERSVEDEGDMVFYGICVVLLLVQGPRHECGGVKGLNTVEGTALVHELHDEPELYVRDKGHITGQYVEVGG